MKRTTYRHYVIDTDDLGRLYIHDTRSPYSEESDRILIDASDLDEALTIIDVRVLTGRDVRNGWSLTPMRHYRVKDEYRDLWSSDPDWSGIVTSEEVERLAREWGMSVDDELTQLEEV